jgi:hypothetical protein
MFRTSGVHLQEDYIVHAVCYDMFSNIYASSLAGRRMCCAVLCCNTSLYLLDCLHKCMKTYHNKLHVQYNLPEDERVMYETCKRQDGLI